MKTSPSPINSLHYISARSCTQSAVHRSLRVSKTAFLIAKRPFFEGLCTAIIVFVDTSSMARLNRKLSVLLFCFVGPIGGCSTGRIKAARIEEVGRDLRGPILLRVGRGAWDKAVSSLPRKVPDDRDTKQATHRTFIEAVPAPDNPDDLLISLFWPGHKLAGYRTGVPANIAGPLMPTLRRERSAKRPLIPLWTSQSNLEVVPFCWPTIEGDFDEVTGSFWLRLGCDGVVDLACSWRFLPDTNTWICGLAYCGDGIADAGEGCDRGPANSDIVPNACRTNCQPPWCGDGVVDNTESCETGPCCQDCQLKPVGAPCDTDANLCTVAFCTSTGACLFDHENECNPPNPPCDSGEQCNPVTGICESEPDPHLGVACDRDHNSCTNDQCNGLGACVFKDNADGASCSADGIPCTDDICREGVCGHIRRDSRCAQPCSVGRCDSTVGCTFETTTYLTDSDCKRLYVDKDATGVPIDGSTWFQAFRNLQDALSHARTNPGTINEIWVAEGRYTPDIGGGMSQFSTGARFSLVAGVALYGGFAGTETSFDQRVYVECGTAPHIKRVAPPAFMNKTVLSGDLRGDDRFPQSCSADGDCTPPDICFHEFEWAPPGEGFCTFRDPATTDDNSDTIIEAVADTLINGFTLSGGNNAITVTSVTNPARVEECTFRSNGVQKDGAAIRIVQASCAISKCTFIANVANSLGGAIYIDGCVEKIDSGTGMCVAVSGCPTLTCKCDDDERRVTVKHSLFLRNAAQLGGAIYSGFRASPLVANCVFNGNAAQKGGVVVAVNNFWCGPSVAVRASPQFVNCTVTRSRAPDAGAILCIDDNCDFRIANSILWGNDCGSGCVAFSCVSDSPIGNPSFTLRHAIVQGAATNPISCEYSLDPQFADPDGPDGLPMTLDDQLWLRSGSPANDTGDNAAASLDGGLSTDLAANSRFTDDPLIVFGFCAPGGLPPFVDLGAYELAATPPCPE